MAKEDVRDEQVREDRNKGKGIPDYDEKNPNPNDIHSDDPLVAGLANGTRQVTGEGDEIGAVS